VFTRRLHAENRPVIALCDHPRVTVDTKTALAAILAGACFAFAAPALAENGKGPVKGTTTAVPHPGPVKVQGVVQSVSASTVVVRQLDGSAVSVAIDRRTKITIAGHPGKIGDVKPGFVLVITVKAGQSVGGDDDDEPRRLLETPDAWALSAGRESLPSQLVRGYERQKAGFLPGQALTA
jgi:hypothetical protein